MVMFIVLYKVVLSVEFVDEILKYHSNESFCTVRSCGVVYSAVQGGSNSCDCGQNPKVRPFK